MLALAIGASTTEPPPTQPVEPEHEVPPAPRLPEHPRGPIAFTGFDSEGVAAFGLVLLAAGLGLTLVARRRRGQAM